MTAERDDIPYEPEIRFILRAALLLFVYTVVIGIVNGLDLVDFSRKPLLAHLHVGTLGWITMAVFAGALWLFGAPGQENRTMRWVARSAPVVALAYNAAFFTTTGMARPVMGSLMMLVIVVFFAWGVLRARVTPLSVPHLGMLAGLATSVIGAVLGVLTGVMVAAPDANLAETIPGAHPATMVVGFLVPVGMAFIEWVVRPESSRERASLAGRFQIGLPFAGGLLLLVGILADAIPLIMLSLPLQVIGVVIFLVRMAPAIRRVSLLHGGAARHGVLATPFLVVNIAILVYLITNYIEDFEAAPRRLVLALDHSIFVGVLTHSILGLLAGMSLSSRPAWVDHAVFWGVTIGVAGFIGGLLADQTAVLRVFTPLLGAAILLATAAHLSSVVTGRRGAASPAAR